MPPGNIRNQRINGLLLREISDIVPRLKDRHVGFTTVLRVLVSRDMRHAKVFVSVLGEKKQPTVDALNKAAGFIQHELSQRVELRFMPHLVFILDQSLDHSLHIGEVLARLRENGELGSDAPEEDAGAPDETPAVPPE